VLAGRFWADGTAGVWAVVDGERVGIAVIDDLDDVAEGGNPVLDLRLAESHRGRGVGVLVLRALTELVFARWPDVTRFEGQTRDDNVAMRAAFGRAGWVKEAIYRDAWPVEGAPARPAIGYAVLRRDWESGTTTPVVWDDM
jgi:RimJ/RimL family protein N-acetyltransferase